MDSYQFLTLEIIVPRNWPVRGIHGQITEMVQNAISHYSLGQQVVVTIGTVSALVTQGESEDDYFFQRIQEVPNAQIYGIYLIFPESISMRKPNSGTSDAEMIPIPLLAANLKFHSLDPKSLKTILGNSYMKIAVPNLQRILQSLDIEGTDKYDCLFKCKYRVHENIQLSTILRQFTFKKDPVNFHAKISKHEWDVVYYDQIPKPLWRRSIWKTKNSTCCDPHSNSNKINFI